MADVSRLPGPNADTWDWQLLGLCRGEDPNMFFHRKLIPLRQVAFEPDAVENNLLGGGCSSGMCY